ncbi:hypothetical protein FSP39_004789 [Pinctada imbricata]|uniref:Tyrosinase copper-binding domain-containing protein n=1 Tax=Pinctada imbricata TaxID=66713 RepID=A0AA88YL18_PINIB|nr:hypothetical protein FSP39_004789 [Pinctada imbricata]
MKHKRLHINQRDQWATGADLGRPSATSKADGVVILDYVRTTLPLFRFPKSLLFLSLLVLMMSYDRSYVSGKITYEALPSELDDCFQKLYSENDVIKDTAEAITTSCLSDYIWKNVAVRCYDLTQKSLDYIGGMLSPYFDENNREKRDPPRIRKEYRSLTTEEREKFHTALNQLKSDTSVSPNAYDVIARFHNFGVARAAHGGSAFLPWHRVYLFILENALRTKQPDVTIPYWDFLLDGNLESGESVMWTKDFMGSTDDRGMVQDGPVKDWDIRRQIGSGRLADERRISEMLGLNSSTEFAQLLERYHNRGHGWVGGNMWGLETAPFDPMFFLLHCYIDYLWWQWQSDNKEESFTWEYPSNDFGPHGEDEVAMGLQINGNNITNGEAFGMEWAFEYVQYEPRPSCVCEKPTCIGPNMRCEFQSGAPAICVTATTSMNCRRKREAENPIHNGNPVNDDLQEQKRSKRANQMKRSPISNVVAKNSLHSSKVQKVDVQIVDSVLPLMKKPKVPQVKDYIHDHRANMSSIQHEIHSSTDHVFSIQNDFEINCEKDSNLWVYMPFKVIHLRPQGQVYNSHSVTKGKITDEQDMFNEKMYKSLTTRIHPENPIAYEKCELDISGATRVTVTSYGISYHGVYRDYVILDNRQAIDGKVGYIAFKRPDDHPSKLILTAFDECGRICTPKCKVQGSNPPQYKPCSGVLNIDGKKPKPYGGTYGEVVLKVWNFKKGACPETRETEIDLVFNCEYKKDWFPWF